MRNEVGFMDAKDQRQRDFLRSVQSLPPLSSVFLCLPGATAVSGDVAGIEITGRGQKVRQVARAEAI